MTLKEGQNAALSHIALKDRWKHLPEKKHRTIGNVLVLMRFPLCVTLSIVLPFLAMIASDYFIGEPNPNDVATLRFNTSFFIVSLILTEAMASGALCLYWTILGYVAARFHGQSSRHDLTLGLIQDSANREVYRLANLCYQEHVESLRASCHFRIEDLYSANAGAETVSEVRDELRTALHESEARMEDVRQELLQNEGKQDYLDFNSPKLSEISLEFALLCVAAIIVLAIQYQLMF